MFLRPAAVVHFFGGGGGGGGGGVLLGQGENKANSIMLVFI